MARPSKTELKIRAEEAEADLLTFIRLVAPHRVLGAVHEELCRWWSREGALDNQLVLLPRDHQKSAMVAYRVAWWLTKNPDVTILYVSATADLAEKQLKFVKDILLSDNYRKYWPEMVDVRENFRERWSADEIAVDHPKRKAEAVRDPTVKAVGLTANTTGLHCHIAVLDDVVVPNNAYTETGRDQVKAFYSQLSSIETTGAREWVVGTRYHPNDLYKELIDMKEYIWNEKEEEDEETPVYEVFERVVEVDGEFLWPKQRRKDGKTFGFDDRELARKKAKYLDITQFYAQYYNNPNAVETQIIDRSRFQYYDRDRVKKVSGVWYMGEKNLNVYAAIDFAYSVGSKANYTVIMVVGVDEDNNIYVLDIDRFRTSKISEMYLRVVKMYEKWKFKKLRAEAVAAQKLIVQQFKDYMRQSTVIFSIDEYYPPKTMDKAERVASILEPRYSNNMIWHYKGGHCQILEEELLLTNSEYDDIKDALSAVVEIARPPMRTIALDDTPQITYHNKFGGVSFVRT